MANMFALILVIATLGGFRRGDPRPRRGYAGAPAGSPPREGR